MRALLFAVLLSACAMSARADDAMAPFACTPLRETARISALVRERLAL